MLLLGGEEIGSSGDERSKPFEFFLVRIASHYVSVLLPEAKPAANFAICRAVRVEGPCSHGPELLMGFCPGGLSCPLLSCVHAFHSTDTFWTHVARPEEAESL